MYPKMLLQISFCFEILLAHITSENVVWMYLLVLLQSFLGCVWVVFTVILFAEKLAQVSMDFLVISKFIWVPEDLLTCTALVFKSKVHHHVLVMTTVTVKILATVSAVKSLCRMYFDNMLVKIFVFVKFLWAPVTGVTSWSLLSFWQTNSGQRNNALWCSNSFGDRFASIVERSMCWISSGAFLVWRSQFVLSGCRNVFCFFFLRRSLHC